MKILYFLLSIAGLFWVMLSISDRFDNDGAILNEWSKTQVKAELSVFEKNKFKEADISKTYMDLSGVAGNSLLRFQIVGGAVYSDYSSINKSNMPLVSAYNTYYKFFTSMIKRYDFGHGVEFIISVGDDFTSPAGYDFKVPVIVPVKNSSNWYAKFTPLAPDSYTISEWPRLYKDILSANDKYPWSRKIEKAFWRGSGTGGLYTRENWQNFPRVKLVEISEQNPNLINAQFTALPQGDAELMNELSEKYPLAIAVSQADHVKYKVQIYIEGGATSFSGYLWRLLSNSVVLKQSSNNIQWFYPILTEGKDYITIAYDMSDVLDKVKWAHEHDLESIKSAADGSELIKKEITPEHLYLYWDYLLTEYSKLQDFRIDAPTLPKAKEIE